MGFATRSMRLFLSTTYGSLLALGAGSMSMVIAQSVMSAPPEVTEVELEDDLIGGSAVQVYGKRFGNDGPEIVVFDDFATGTPGEVIDLNSALVGSWTSSRHDPKYDGRARSGQASMRSRDGGFRTLELRLAEKSRDLFLSYWVRIPEGTRFPGDTSKERDFSQDSSWKFVWIFDGSGGYKHNDQFDMVLPSHINYGNFALSGNSYRPESGRHIGNAWWSWDEWMRVSVHIQDPVRVGVEDNVVFEAVSADKGWHRATATASTHMIPL